MNIAIIPARGGSRRIPGKNIKDFLGKPIIAYSINAALQSGIFDQVIVSTDSEEIANVAKEFGASVPFLRPTKLGENQVNVSDVLHYTLSELLKTNPSIEFCCCIVATAPFIASNKLVEGYKIIQSQSADTVMSVTRFPFPIQRAFELDQEGFLTLVQPKHEFSHSNTLPESFHDAAQFYFLNTKSFMETHSILGQKVYPIILPNHQVRDIDTMEDWLMAEIMYQTCKERGLL
jgi:N-acylneuraminate cytidylyltransferase